MASLARSRIGTQLRLHHHLLLKVIRANDAIGGTWAITAAQPLRVPAVSEARCDAERLLTGAIYLNIHSMNFHIMKDDVMSKAHSTATDAGPPTRSVLLESGVPLRRTPAALARRFAQICLAVVAESLADEDVTPLQYAALAHLNDEPDIDQNGLAARLGVEQSHASLLVEQLVVLGLVERRVNGDDRRARMIRLTTRGARLYQRLQPGARARRNRMLAPLTSAEREVFLDQLVRIISANETYARPGAGRRKRRSPASAPTKMRATRNFEGGRTP